MFLFVPAAPLIGEGLLWGLGLLTSGYTTSEIVKNREAISNAMRGAYDQGKLKVKLTVSLIKLAINPPTAADTYSTYHRPIVLDDNTKAILARNRSVPQIYRFDDIEDRGEDSATPTTNNNTLAASQSPAPNPKNDKNKDDKNNEDKKKEDKKKESAFKEESKKVLGNLGKGYGKVLKGAAYGTGFGAPIVGLGYGIYRATRPDPTYADSVLNALMKLIEEFNKLNLINRNQQIIDSLLREASKGVSTNPTPLSAGLPKGFVPIVGLDPNDSTRVVTYSSSGKPDSIVTLLARPDISNFRRNGRNNNQ